ncbi:MAG: efflux RND transporter permease subunit [Desulfobacteraceae bacterium]|nr:MAG: efflux RND transporter permease subunit [Desulfobacteraceae bacterium]
MNSLKRFTNVYVSMDMNKPEYQVRLDRTRAAELGISVADVAVTARSLLSGAVATRYRQGDEFYNIRVMIPEERISSRRDIEELVLNFAQGGYLRLRDVAEVHSVQFNSLRLPGLILGSVPFCAAGMVYALYLADIPMGATVLIRLLVVVAATVNEGVLLLTVVEELRGRHQITISDALVQAAQIRLRPRVMIAAAVIAGFIPLALNLEEGGDMLQPMAVAAIGGLSLGLFVALFLLPCLYLAVSRKESVLDIANPN